MDGQRREKLPDPTLPHFGSRVAERLNAAAIGGFQLGIAAMFWANRLVARATDEHHQRHLDRRPMR